MCKTDRHIHTVRRVTAGDTASFHTAPVKLTWQTQFSPLSHRFSQNSRAMLTVMQSGFHNHQASLSPFTYSFGDPCILISESAPSFIFCQKTSAKNILWQYHMFHQTEEWVNHFGWRCTVPKDGYEWLTFVMVRFTVDWKLLLYAYKHNEFNTIAPYTGRAV